MCSAKLSARPIAAPPRQTYAGAMINDDPTVTDPEHYVVLWENEYVRVLSYADEPGQRTHPHDHPNSVMVTLTSFRRLLIAGEREAQVELPAGRAVWLPAQRHAGENIGTTPTQTILIELKGAAAGEAGAGALGPAASGAAGSGGASGTAGAGAASGTAASGPAGS